MEIGVINEMKIEDDAIICTVYFGASDVVTATLFGLCSISEYPRLNDEVVVKRGDDENVVMATFRPAPDDMSTGESIMYSRDSDGVFSASVKVCSDGQVKINGGGRSIAAYQELKEGFDKLLQDFNALVAAYNAHIHLTTATIALAPVGVIAPTTSQASTSSASIDSCESETVETK